MTRHTITCRGDMECSDGGDQHEVTDSVTDSSADWECVDCGMRVWQGEDDLGSGTQVTVID